MFTKEQQEELDKIELHSYEDILERIYDKVYLYKEYGSYQGDWLAHVKKGDKDFWIKGCYGSCSGCDWFQGEENYPWFWGGEEPDFEVTKKLYEEETNRLIKAFEEDYGADIYTKEEILEYLQHEVDEGWDDSDTREMLRDVKGEVN